MDWIFANLKLVVFLVVGVIYAIKMMRGKEDASRTSPTARPPLPDTDPAEAERTRQIQEEIRRRILARQRGENWAEPPAPVVQEQVPPEVVAAPPPLPRSVHVPAAAPASAYEIPQEQTAILDAQRALEEQFRMVQRMRESATAGIARLPSAVSAQVSAAGGSVSSFKRGLRRDLRDHRITRRAILLRELLGDPVALRTGPLPRR